MKIKLYNTIAFNNCKLKLTHDAKDTRFSLFQDRSKRIVQYYPENGKQKHKITLFRFFIICFKIAIKSV